MPDGTIQYIGPWLGNGVSLILIGVYIRWILSGVKSQVTEVKSSIETVRSDFKADLKDEIKDLKKEYSEGVSTLKAEFHGVCSERQAACSGHVQSQLDVLKGEAEKLWGHGHKGLDKDGNQIIHSAKA